MSVRLYLGDCIEVLRGLDENSVDTCITDPPYGLGFMGKEWDTFDKSQFGIAGSEGANDLKVKKNFNVLPRYGSSRDLYNFTFEWASEVYRVLKPGALLLAFGGTRTYHRLVCGIEDAGWEVRDSMAWLYGSGFPKSYDISKGIDKQAGIIGTQSRGFNTAGGAEKYQPQDKSFRSDYGYVYEPQDPMAKLWHGWGTALKPAMELICVAMKPIDGGFVHNALTWGVAGLWIDGGRVEASDSAYEANSNRDNVKSHWGNSDGAASVRANSQGRFPANVIHDGSDEVTGLFPNDAQRFFYSPKASRSERNAGLEGMPEMIGGGMQGTADQTLLTGSGNIRNNKMQNGHPTVKPLALMRYLVRLTKTPTGGVVLDPFMGSGTTGCACALEGRDFIGIEREADYLEIAEKRIAHWALQPTLQE